MQFVTKLWHLTTSSSPFSECSTTSPRRAWMHRVSKRATELQASVVLLSSNNLRPVFLLGTQHRPLAHDPPHHHLHRLDPPWHHPLVPPRRPHPPAHLPLLVLLLPVPALLVLRPHPRLCAQLLPHEPSLHPRPCDQLPLLVLRHHPLPCVELPLPHPLPLEPPPPYLPLAPQLQCPHVPQLQCLHVPRHLSHLVPHHLSRHVSQRLLSPKPLQHQLHPLRHPLSSQHLAAFK
mmetsp:Transcript_33719/g.54645  ORF Transcript_33719/g.54645 Transcript_33719/m.54645 type:complete len:233 (+) Transcript_33719:350-1048(+)